MSSLMRKGGASLHCKWKYGRHLGYWGGKINNFLTFNSMGGLIRFGGSEGCYVGFMNKINDLPKNKMMFCIFQEVITLFWISCNDYYRCMAEALN